MQKIYAAYIDAFDYLVMLPLKKQMIFFLFLIAVLFWCMWFLMLNSSFQTYSLHKKQQQNLMTQIKLKKPLAIVKAQSNQIGETFFCDKEVVKKQKIGTIKTERKIINYYETDKGCLLKETLSSQPTAK